jgi:oxygen-dependent protoporphyrinogen oxidase
MKFHLISHKSQVSTPESQESYDHVIAAIPAPALTKILAAPPQSTNHPVVAGHSSPRLPSDTIQKLKSFDYATTVMVVNLYYSNPNLLSRSGFGYLIPRSTPASENQECGLGVIFASESSSGREIAECEDAGAGAWRIKSQPVEQDTAKGTKLTVMMGGHYWDHFRPGDYPDHETAISMACNMLKRHLGITDKPAIARARLQQDAIPQYTVGHLDRMYELSRTVKRDFDQRLVLTGNWYNGVGVGDCIKQGIMAATYGVGYKLPPRMTEFAHTDQDYHLAFDCENWDMQGGIPTAPIRIVDVQPR